MNQEYLSKENLTGRKIIHQLYLDYVNNFVTVGGFASYYGVSLSRANRVINIGRSINRKAFG